MNYKTVDVVLRIKCDESFKSNDTLLEVNNSKNSVELLSIGIGGQTVREYKHKQYGQGFELRKANYPSLIEANGRFLCPSKHIFDYFESTGGDKITPSMIAFLVADVAGGFHISYSGTELLKDLGFLTTKGNLTKRSLRYLSYQIHAQYFEKIDGFVVQNLFSNEETKS